MAPAGNRPQSIAANFDMGIFKHFAIKESMALEFRAEAFNIFNHSQFYISNTPGGTDSMTCETGPQRRIMHWIWGFDVRSDQQRSPRAGAAVQPKVPLLTEQQPAQSSKPGSEEAGFFMCSRNRKSEQVSSLTAATRPCPSVVSMG